MQQLVDFKHQPKIVSNQTESAGQQIPQMQVERIIGMSQCGCNGSSPVLDGWVSSSGAISICPKNGDIAYIAGAFIVIYGVKTSIQEKFLKNEKNRPYQCLAYSPKGEYLAAGDCSTKAPEITVWHVNEMEGNGRGYQAMYHLSGHRFGIQSLKFSPMEDYLISLGDPNDRGLFVWDFKNQQRVTSNRLGRVINAFEFEQNQKYFVTAGFTHLKFWYFEKDTNKVKKQNVEGYKESIMESFSADINKVKNKIFVGVACKHSQVYALTNDGLLYCFTEDRKLSRWMNIKVTRAFSCSISQATDQLFCACADGVVRVFNPETLAHVVTLQKPPPLGQTNIESGVKKIKVSQNQVSKFADALAVLSDDIRHRLIVVYSDKMVFLWDVKDQAKIQVSRTFMSHNGPIHDIQKIHQSWKIGIANNEEGQQLSQDVALTRFATCSSDRTVRFWHFADQQQLQSQNKLKIQKGLFRNAYCKDMSKVIFVKSQEQSAANDFLVFRAKPLERDQEGQKIKPETDKENILDTVESRKAQDIEQAIRCIRISPDGNLLACGDWYGNIRIHDLESERMEEKHCIEAHENEILSLDFATTGTSQANQVLIPDPDQDKEQSKSASNCVLVSGSRDHLVQLYDSANSFDPVQIIESHDSTVTSVRFVYEEEDIQKTGDIDQSHFTPVLKTQQQKQLSLITSGADKKLVKHSLIKDKKLNDFEPFEQKGIENFKNKIFSMDVSQSLVLTGHDQTLTLSYTNTLSKIWQKRPDPNRKVIPDHLKVMLDDQGKVAVTSTTDKQLMLFDTQSGKLLAKAQCGEIITGMCFSDNRRHIITTSSQGVIYIFKLPEPVIKLLNMDRIQQAKQQAIKKQSTILHQIAEEELEDTVKRGSNMKSFQSSKLGQSKQNNPILSELDDVLAQIGQVNNNLEKLEVSRKEKKQQDDLPTQSQGTPRPNNQKMQISSITDPSSMRESEICPLNLNNNNNLPRWAQSFSGINDLSGFGDAQGHQEPFNSKDHQTSMENLFEQNFRQISQTGEELKEESNNDTGKYKIDLLDGNDEDQEDLNINNDDDDEEKEVKISVKQSQFQNMFGIEGEESAISFNLRKSKDWYSKKSKNGVRSSIASKFFLQKDLESQGSAINSSHQKQGSLAVSDIHNQPQNNEYFASANTKPAQSEYQNSNNKPQLDFQAEEGLKSKTEERNKDTENVAKPYTKPEPICEQPNQALNKKQPQIASIQVIESQTNQNQTQKESTPLKQQTTVKTLPKETLQVAKELSQDKVNTYSDQQQQPEQIKPSQILQSVDVQKNMISKHKIMAKSQSQREEVKKINNNTLMSQQVQSQQQLTDHRFPSQVEQTVTKTALKDLPEMSMNLSIKSLAPSLHQSVQSQSINFQLHFEIQRLNESLKNINQLLNLGQSSYGDETSFANNSDIKSDYNKLLVANQSIAPSEPQAAQMDPKVADKLSQSIGLFNNVMNQVQKQDNFDYIQKQGLMYSQQFSNGAFSSTQSIYKPSESISMQSVAPSNINDQGLKMVASSLQAPLTQTPIETEHLLDKYSEILLEKLLKKMEQKQNK